ncbi:NAD(P)-dependent alcohol dehydrogenase [Allorhizocola rhizosphaerae]|uniref:NAD(P)-dependent alcohol dehydrogenase n=1 Tax=Allorhizocola rhizosphaerae TaxID=1872709 RepID=UPI000E3ED866|nr:NAD(P)-dependent alcohol dehydrogenase [Allorhizocola rhizosphaerae]
MKAIVRARYGGADALSLQEVEQPEPGDGELLIRVHAASVDAGVVHLMTGEPYLMRLIYGLRAPKLHVLGMDAAGVVAAVGKGVTAFRPGDEVYAEVRAGSFAEYTTVPEGLASPKPANLTFEEAAAVPSSANPALIGLRDVARVRPGQSVLVNGASGGVGTFAVQIAKWLGADVTGVCSASKMDLVRSIGADHVIDYVRSDFTAGKRRYDAILDLAGNHGVGRMRRALAQSGVLALSSGKGGRWIGPIGRIAAGALMNPFTRQRIGSVMAAPSGENLATLKKLFESGTIRPVVDRTFPLAETAEAIRYFMAGKARGKVAIAV